MHAGRGTPPGGIAAGAGISWAPAYGTSGSGPPLCTIELGKAPAAHSTAADPAQAVSVPQTWPPTRQRQLERPPKDTPSSTHGARRAASDAAPPSQGPYTAPRRTAVAQTHRGRGEHVSRSGTARGPPTSARAEAPRTASRGWPPPPRQMDCTGRGALAGFPALVRRPAVCVPPWPHPAARSSGGPSMPSCLCWRWRAMLSAERRQTCAAPADSVPADQYR